MLAENPEVKDERQALRQRRDELAGLLGEGLVTAAAARPQLESLADRLVQLERQTSPPVLQPDLLRLPVETWWQLAQPQRRAVLRLLFDRVAVRHAGASGGPRADQRRIHVQWAQPA